MSQLKPLSFYLLACLTAEFARADVPAPPTTPAPPSGYCSTIYNELNGDLQAFNTVLSIPPIWKPITGPATLYGANLQSADGNVGPGLSSANYINNVQVQLQEEKALGVTAVMVPVEFPVLYAPFFGGQTEMQPYLSFYTQVAQAVRAAGMKLIVENNILLNNDIEAGWPNVASFYTSLSWSQYMAARATMAATVAQNMKPDYLVLSEEPDSEALQTGQSNMNIPADAADMISAQITAVKALKLSNIKLGAGMGNWLGATGTSSLTAYLAAYVLLPLDYIDFHVYPINTEVQASLIANTLVIASTAALAGKPVAMSEGWAWKMENSEFGVLADDVFRSRDPFSFWAPIDQQFVQTMKSLAKYTNMLYLAPENPDYLFSYQTYGGTTANGGAANCTCTTASCSSDAIVSAETTLAGAANANADFTATGFSYSADVLSSPDKTAPSEPAGFAATPAYNQVNLAWSASSDNVGVAGYNVYRCSPPTEGQSCTMAWLANATSTSYVDSGLPEQTAYNYQVQAFDLQNNHSPMSPVVSTATYKSSPSAPSNLMVTIVSATTVNLSWSAPQDAAGLSQYLIYAGTSQSSLTQIGARSASGTTFTARSLSPSTEYFFEIAAVESGVTSPMSPANWGITDPLPGRAHQPDRLAVRK